MVPKQPICLILFFLLNSALVITSSRLSNDTDHEALVAFKNSITNDPFNVLSSWNDSLQFCKWGGITCGARHPRVTALILPSCHLGGTLAPHIGNLTFLRTLDLLDNNIRGPIPQEISRLSRIVNLFLGNNSFQGDIPNNLSRSLKLEIIDLTSNNIEGTIPSELGSLTRLSYLRIAINNLSGRIPPSIGNLSSLLRLSLGRNNLKGNIPDELGQLSNLYFLQLSANGLSGLIPPSIYNLSSLKTFSVAYNNLSGIIVPSLGLTLPKLQELYLENNQFHGLIPPTLANASGLSILYIGDNSFMGPLPKNFGSLNNLLFVHFANNSLVGNLAEFIHSLSNCSKLETLELSYNNFSCEFPRSIANLSTTLTWLSVWNANLTGIIPREIEKLTNLQYLALNENMLTGDIPNTIGNISELEGFYFYSNRISGEIPSSIGNLTKLSILSGSENLLERIPSSLGNCTNLQGIYLEWNKFSGPIPKRLFDISYLPYGIFLSNNLFNGMLPAEVGNLMNIESLDVSNNRLSGNIPSSLGRCQVLESLSMQGNAFNGSIPESFAQLKGIRHLDLSNNQLSGHIPRFLAELSIEYLNISNNFLDGEVPSEGVFKNISAFSVVGNDKLCGGIKELKLPSCPVKYSKRKRKKPLNLRLILPLATILPTVFLLLLLSSIVYFIRRSKQAPSSISTLPGKYPKLSYADLSVATNGFSTSNLVGEGRYGSVYRGNLDVVNEMVAVKVLNLQQRGANKSFTAECEALRSIRHRNLVKIITSCSSIDFKGQDFKALVYEYMPNGSLESALHPTLSEEPKFLSLIQRMNIAIDVASALDYLHNHCEPPIVHCDIKPSNILLDNDLCARVSDFGLAKILSVTSGVSNHQSSSTSIRGTIGYVAPEYGINFVVSKEGDMFSYGILLLEMFTGKRPTSSAFVDNHSLHDYARMSLQHHVMEIVDPQILQEEKSGRNSVSKIGVCLRSILEIGVACSQEHAGVRMDAKDALTQLHKIRKAYTSSN